MRNWHYILGGIIVLIAAQGYYLAWFMADWFDLQNGITWATPDGYSNPYERWPQISRCGLELALSSIVAHTVLNTPTNAYSKALWVFIGLSAWNQFVDAVIGDMYTFSPQEVIALCVALVVSISTFVKWQKKKYTN